MRTVIMGGSSGIRLATAELLAGEGAEVIVTGRDETKLAAVRPRVAGAERVDGTSPKEVADRQLRASGARVQPGRGGFSARYASSILRRSGSCSTARRCPTC
jgi:NAD(P)-dependent dehydrogenase (short-subunit alcohol dehydrogenase family)